MVMAALKPLNTRKSAEQGSWHDVVQYTQNALSAGTGCSQQLPDAAFGCRSCDFIKLSTKRVHTNI
jgi:hypothetical protein